MVRDRSSLGSQKYLGALIYAGVRPGCHELKSITAVSTLAANVFEKAGHRKSIFYTKRTGIAADTLSFVKGDRQEDNHV